MTIGEFEKICNLTVELTRLRQNECKHLSIENFAPELLVKLLAAATTTETKIERGLPVGIHPAT